VHLECQQFVLQVKEAECREAEVERDAMAKKVGDLEMANQVQRGRSGRREGRILGGEVYRGGGRRWLKSEVSSSTCTLTSCTVLC